ncbi:hypothetical protein D3C86_1619970 [compost metagenome]
MSAVSCERLTSAEAVERAPKRYTSHLKLSDVGSALSSAKRTMWPFGLPFCDLLAVVLSS